MLKNKNGFTGIDVAISLLAIIIFTSVILALMYNVRLENLKIQAKSVANIYLIETLENIGIAKYDDVTENNTSLIPQMPEAYQVTLNIINISQEDNTKTDDIIKKVKAIISYQIGNKTYMQEVERLKVKEQ